MGGLKRTIIGCGVLSLFSLLFLCGAYGKANPPIVDFTCDYRGDGLYMCVEFTSPKQSYNKENESRGCSSGIAMFGRRYKGMFQQGKACPASNRISSVCKMVQKSAYFYSAGGRLKETQARNFCLSLGGMAVSGI